MLYRRPDPIDSVDPVLYHRSTNMVQKPTLAGILEGREFVHNQGSVLRQT